MGRKRKKEKRKRKNSLSRSKKEKPDSHTQNLSFPLKKKKKTRPEIIAFSDRLAEFKAIGAEVLGVSVDSQFSHLAWIQTDRKEGGVGEFRKIFCFALFSFLEVETETEKKNSPLLSLPLSLDPQKLTPPGDLAYPLVADLKKEVSESFGVLSPDGIALRGLFIIDREGVVQHSTINNLSFGRSVDETLRVLQALQHVQVRRRRRSRRGGRIGGRIGGRERERELKK